jgi:hypothetical protein
MDKSTLKIAMLSAISEEIDLWLDKETGINDGYEYESEFIKTAHKINHILLSNASTPLSNQSMGAVSCNRNKKNFIPVLGNLK